VESRRFCVEKPTSPARIKDEKQRWYDVSLVAATPARVSVRGRDCRGRSASVGEREREKKEETDNKVRESE